MKILSLDRKNNAFEVMPDSFDDLWHLEKIIDIDDLVSGSSERKIKAKTEGEKAFKTKVFVELKVEKKEFHETTNQLRIQGVVVYAQPEELVELKSHHTIEVEPGFKLKVKKESLKNYHIERLEKAKAGSGREKLLIVVMDDEAADVVFLRDAGIENKAKIIASKQGKQFEKSEKEKPYFVELLSKIKELGAQRIVIAGPGFEKSNFEKFLNEKHEKLPIVFESTNSVGITGINELLKSGKVDKLIEGFQAAQEEKIVEKLMEMLSKETVAIGFEEVEKAVKSGAIEDLIVEETLMAKKREEVEKIIDKAEQTNSKVHFVSQKTEAGKKIEGLGGLAATLRYKLDW